MFGYVHEDDMAPVATMSEAVDEWARNVGHYPRFIGCQWLNHDYDVWVRNPHYTGPDQGHPEDPEPEDEWMTVGLPTGANDPPYFAPIGGSEDDDIPF